MEVERGDTMLLLLIKNYYLLYGMTAAFILGVTSRIWLHNLYQRYIGDSQTMGNPKENLLKQIKIKFEGCYRINHGVNNTSALTKRYLYNYVYKGFTLNGIRNILWQSFYLCVFFSVAAMFSVYLLKLSTNLLLLYLIAGMLFCLGMLEINKISDISYKQDQLEANINDYLENTFANHLRYEMEVDVLQLQNAIEQTAANMEKERKVKKIDKTSFSEEDNRIIEEIMKEFFG